jgi:hypothetical protein
MARVVSWRRARCVWMVLAALAVAVAARAGDLPAEARGSTWLLDPAQQAHLDLISYRMLEPSDFRARRPPPQARVRLERLGAATCSYLVPDPVRMVAAPRKTRSGGWEYVAHPEHLRFHGAMDRGCSFWNANDPAFPPAYVLQHEQIHFALTELEARHLNAREPELMKRLTVADPSADAAIEASRVKLQALLEDAARELLDRSNAFDADCSLTYHPQAQEKWWKRVQGELAATARYAHGAGGAGADAKR